MRKVKLSSEDEKDELWKQLVVSAVGGAATAPDFQYLGADGVVKRAIEVAERTLAFIEAGTTSPAKP